MATSPANGAVIDVRKNVARAMMQPAGYDSGPNPVDTYARGRVRQFRVSNATALLLLGALAVYYVVAHGALVRALFVCLAMAACGAWRVHVSRAGPIAWLAVVQHTHDGGDATAGAALSSSSRGYGNMVRDARPVATGAGATGGGAADDDAVMAQRAYVAHRTVGALCSLATACLLSAAWLFALPGVDDAQAPLDGLDFVVVNDARSVAWQVHMALDVGAAPAVALLLFNSHAGLMGTADAVVCGAVWSAVHLALALGVGPLGSAGYAGAVVQAWLLVAVVFALAVADHRATLRELWLLQADGSGRGASGRGSTAIRGQDTDEESGAEYKASATAGGLPSRARSRVPAEEARRVAAAKVDLKSGSSPGVGSPQGSGSGGDPPPLLRDQGIALLREIKRLMPSQAGLLSYCLTVVSASHATEAKQLKLMQSNAAIMDDVTKEWLQSTLELRRAPGYRKGRSSNDIASKLSGSGRVSSAGSLTSPAPAGSVTSHSHAADWPPPEPVQAVLEDILTFEFDVFQLAGLSPLHRLSLVAYELFLRFELFAIFDLDHSRFFAFMTRVEHTYSYDPRSPNPYHDALHAADVVQAVACFLQEPRVQDPLDDLETLSVLFSGIMHDYRHPGVSNAFLVASKAAIAIRYNDDSVLENFHSASAFMLLAKPQFQLFAHLDPATYKRMRQLVIGCILATDLAKGARILENFKAKILLPIEADELARDELDQDARLQLMSMAIKCADVGHPTRPFRLHLQWSKMITAEFYAQGDLERMKGLAVSPLCDRRNHDLSKSQIGFIDFVVRPAFDLFSRFAGTRQWAKQLQLNYLEWKSGRIESDPKEFATPTGHHPRFAMRSLTLQGVDDDVPKGPPQLPPTAEAVGVGGSAGAVGASRSGAPPRPAGSLSSFVVTAPGAASASSLTESMGTEGRGAGGSSVTGGLMGLHGDSAASGAAASSTLSGASAGASTRPRALSGATSSGGGIGTGGAVSGGGASGSGGGGAANLRAGNSADAALHVGTPLAARSSGGSVSPKVGGGLTGLTPHRRTSTGEGLVALDKGANVATVQEVRDYAVPMPQLRSHNSDVLMENVELHASAIITDHLPDPDSAGAHDDILSTHDGASFSGFALGSKRDSRSSFALSTGGAQLDRDGDASLSALSPDDRDRDREGTSTHPSEG